MSLKVHRKLLFTLLLLGVIASALLLARRPLFSLTLRMSSTVPSTAQLFFDSGRGFNEQDSRTAPISSRDLRDFQVLTFDLPRRGIGALRFDPLTVPGSFVIRDVTISEEGRVLLHLAPSQLVPLNQIASYQMLSDRAVFLTTPNANDPGLTIRLRAPLPLRRIVIIGDLWRFALLWLSLAVVAYVLALDRFASFRAALDSISTRTWSVFERLSARFSNDFLPLNAAALAFYAACALLFVVASFADLNGSSISMYNSGYHRGADQKPLIGAPRASRSDEWAYVTPDILNQSLRTDRFATGDSELGNHSVSLTGNIPVRHVSTLFRPQFWSFFFLPVDYAFSVYWQFKWFLLVTGVFTWLLLITRSTLWAVAGSLWFFFSPFMQWSLSWPSALAEMIGVLCWAMVLASYLTVGRRKLTLFFASIAAASCAINFAMCAYPPHMIPLFWLTVFFFAAWFVSRWREITRRTDAWPRLMAVSLAAFLIAFVGYVVFIDLRSAIGIISDTVYPGRRLFASGTFSLVSFGSHFLQWGETEQHFPLPLGNICEGSGFLWLAPVTLFQLRRMNWSRFQKVVAIALWVTFGLFVAWLLLPFPSALANLMALNRTAAARVIPALGLANVAIVALYMASPQKKGFEQPEIGQQVGLTFTAGIVLFFLLRSVNDHLGSFFTMEYVLAAALFTGFLISLLLTRSSRLLAVCLVASQAVVFGTVNPVMRGLGVITSSPLYGFVHARPDLLHGKWIVFSDSVVYSGFIAATGCEVYTGTRYLPDIDHFPVFAANGIDTQHLNRLGFLDAHLRSPGQRLQVDVPETVIMRLDARPNDALLREIGIRYVALDSRPPDNAVAGLVPLSPTPVDGLWLYRLP